MQQNRQNYQRFDTFYELQKNSLTVLNDPSVIAVLDGEAEQLADCLANSYPLCVTEHKTIEVPPSEIEKENLGIFILLPGENPQAINPAAYFLNLLPSQVQKIRDNGRNSPLLEMAIYNLSTAPSKTALSFESNILAKHIAPIRQLAASMTITNEPVITHARGMMIHSGADTSSEIPMIHEAEHELFMRRTTEQEPEIYSGRVNKQALITRDERQAYRIGARVLWAKGEIEIPGPNVAAYILDKVIADTGPIGNAALSQRKLNTGIAAIDVLLDQPEGQPSDKEIEWYERYGIILS